MAEKMVKSGLIITLFAMFLLAGCNLSSEPHISYALRSEVARDEAPPTDHLAELVADNTDFAFDLYHQMAVTSDDNLIFSPYSISTAFAILYAGAEGDTADQLADALHFQLAPDQLHAAFNALDDALQPPPSENASAEFPPADELTLNITNALWAQRGFSFEPSYLDLLGREYGIGVNFADFAADSEGARREINTWIDQATAGRFRDALSPDAVNQVVRLILLNAIYFKADWSYHFDTNGTHDAPFTLADGSQATVPMMTRTTSQFSCVRGNRFRAIELEYGESRAATFVILMPDQGHFQEIESALNADFLRDVAAEVRFTNVARLHMPRFSFQTSIDLTSVLTRMGAPALFDMGANFTGISPETPLFIDHAEHRAMISVDELGTEAAGFTSSNMLNMLALGECGSEVTIDRPFIFAIRHEATGAILFLGRVMNPAA
ncbi:MAG: serpin family protein [Anaerolineae bacterium]